MANNKKIKGLTVEIGGDTTKLGKALDDSKKKSKNLQSELRQVDKLLKLDPKNTEILAQKQKILTEQVEETKKRLSLLKDEQGKVNALFQKGEIGADEYRKYQREVEQTRLNLRDLETQLKTTGDRFSEVERKSGALTFKNAEDKVAHFKGKVQDMTDAALKNAEKLSKGFEKVGDGLEKAGKTLSVGSAVAGAALGASTKLAMDFEDAMAKVSTIADENEAPMDKMREQILALSNDTGVAATDIAENVYNAISAGQKTGDAVNFVAKSLSLSKAGFADTGAALDVLTTIMNAYGMSAEEVGEISDILIQTQNLGKVTVGELASSMGKVIPTANQYGVSLDQLAAAYSITTAKGIAAAESTTYINSMLNELGKSGTKTSDLLKEKTGKTFTELMKEGYSLSDVLQIVAGSAAEGVNYFNKIGTTIQNATGKSFEELQDEGYSLSQIIELINQRNGDNKRSFNELNQALKDGTGKSFKQLSEEGYDLSEILTLVDEKTVESVKGFSDMWGSAEAAKAATTLLGDSAGDFNNRLKEMNGSTGATDKALGKLKTTSTETKKIVNELKNAGIDLGNEVLKQAAPLLKDAMGGVKNMTTWLKKLKPEQKETLVKAIEIMAVVGPGVTILGKLTKGVGGLIGDGAKLIKALKNSTVAQMGLNAAMDANPAGVLAIAIVALTTAAIALKKANDDYVNSQWDASDAKRFVDELDAASDRLDDVSKKINDTTKETFEQLDAQISQNSLIDTYQKELDELIGKSELTDAEKSKLDTIVSYLTDNVDGFAEAWDKYTIKDSDGNIRIVGELDEVRQQIDNTIDDFQRLATIEALNQNYSELISQRLEGRRKILEASGKRDSVLDRYQKKLEAHGLSVDDFNKLYGVAGENYFVAQTDMSLWDIRERAKDLDQIAYNELVKLKQALDDYNLELAEQEGLQRSTINLTKDIEDLNVVLKGNYEDAAATLMAYNLGLIDNEDIEKSRWGTLEELQKAARESGKNTELGIGEDLDELNKKIYLGEETFEESLINRLAINREKTKKAVDDTAKSVEEGKPQMEKAGKELGESAGKGAQSVDTGKVGKFFVSGFVNSLLDGSAISSVWNAAQNIGNTALNAIKSFLGIHSPSKEAEKLGAFFGEGFSDGILDSKRKTALSAADLADTARNALEGKLHYFTDSVPYTLPQVRILTDYTVTHTHDIRQSAEIRQLRSEIQTMAASIDALAKRPTHLYIDGKTWVGSTINETDRQLAVLEFQKGRGG